MLGTTIRESNRVRSSSVTSTITSLSSIEISIGVVISNSIGVGVGRRFIGVSWGMVGGSSMDNWGMVCGSSMDNWGMVGRGSMIDWSMSYWVSNSMSNWVGNSMSNSMSKSMSNGVSNNTSSTMKTVGRVSYSSNSSSKSLGLSGASVFSLVWLGDRLVGNLASWTAMITSSNYWTMNSMAKMSSKELRGSSSNCKDCTQTNKSLHIVVLSFDDRLIPM